MGQEATIVDASSPKADEERLAAERGEKGEVMCTTARTGRRRRRIKGDRDLVLDLDGPSWMGREGIFVGVRDGRRKRRGREGGTFRASEMGDELVTSSFLPASLGREENRQGVNLEIRNTSEDMRGREKEREHHQRVGREEGRQTSTNEQKERRE